MVEQVGFGQKLTAEILMSVRSIRLVIGAASIGIYALALFAQLCNLLQSILKPPRTK